MRTSILAPILAAVALSACTTLPPWTDARQVAAHLAAQAGLEHAQVASGGFLLTTYSRGLESDTPLTVYIEGDGHAFRRRTRLAADPTPRHPVALALAMRDPGPAVLYVARPCQYLNDQDLSACHWRYWSTHRYAEEVIAAVNGAIDQALARMPAPRPLGLVGYSGGGTVAALIAERRGDVAWLVTIAANLDHAKWTALHELTPLDGSLNAADEARRIHDLPQLHLRGGRDENVPKAVLDAYLARLGSTDAVSVDVIPKYTHACCWEEIWPARLRKFTDSLARHDK